jgi:acid phosphatase
MIVLASTFRTMLPTGLLIVVVTCGGLSSQGLASSPSRLPQKTRASRVPNLPDAQRRVEEYIRSGRYDQDVAEVVASARKWLDKRVKTAVKPAIVLDIDETSLSNWPAYRVNGWARIINGPCDLQNGPCGVRAWQAMGQSKAIAPTLALARHAHDLGVAILFITGRPERLQEQTERNLKEQGYEWNAVILRPDENPLASVVDFKAPERRKLTEQGYTIILNLGDQESDLAGGYAERTFKLPNPVYFVR